MSGAVSHWKQSLDTIPPVPCIALTVLFALCTRQCSTAMNIDHEDRERHAATINGIRRRVVLSVCYSDLIEARVRINCELQNLLDDCGQKMHPELDRLTK